MRELTDAERATRDRRRADFDTFLAERMPVLTNFMQRLELPEPAMVLIEAERYLPALSEFMQRQVVHPDDRDWILARLGYFVGELLVQKFSGYWFLNEIPDSRFFLHYVVGRFAEAPNPNAMVDPFLAADKYLHQMPAASLASIVAKAIEELQTT